MEGDRVNRPHSCRGVTPDEPITTLPNITFWGKPRNIEFCPIAIATAAEAALLW